MFLTYLQVVLFGALGSVSLIIGAFFGYHFNVPERVVAVTMAFTAGLLTSAACFDLLVESYFYGGFEPMITGFFVGVVVFTLADVILNHFSIKKNQSLETSLDDFRVDNIDSLDEDDVRGNINSNNDFMGSLNCRLFAGFNWLKSVLFSVYRRRYDGSFNRYQIGSFITVVGALLDGIPESLSIGLILIIGGPISVSLLVAVFIANLFEGVSSSRNMKLGGWSKKSIFSVWTFVLILSAFSTLFSYSVFSHTDHHILSGALGVAAGALISIIADVLLPEAYKETHEFTGLLMALGLLLSFTLSHLT
ncbi:MAG: hypothetical protein LBC39_06055 [Methanobrevibacter sp.]|nr:hypothetical protein [Candidatus Methanovirga aequatorialis]